MPRPAPPTVSVWHPPHLPGVEVTEVRGDTRLWSGHSTRYAVTGVSAGAFDFWYRGRIRTHTPCSLKLKEPGETHRDVRVYAPVTARTVAFTPARVEDAARALGLPPRPHLAASLLDAAGPTGRALRRLERALGAPAPDALACDAHLDALLAALLVEGAGAAEVPPRTRRRREAMRARDYLHASLAQNVRLSELAAAAGVGRFHLLRLFRAEFGVPPHAYLTQLRVARARTLLAAGVPAGTAAVEVGMYDQSQLNRHFKRLVGLTPGQYARAARSGTPSGQ